MIPESYIESWRTNVPWQTLSMVEQDLVINGGIFHMGIGSGLHFTTNLKPFIRLFLHSGKF